MYSRVTPGTLGRPRLGICRLAIQIVETHSDINTVAAWEADMNRRLSGNIYQCCYQQFRGILRQKNDFASNIISWIGIGAVYALKIPKLGRNDPPITLLVLFIIAFIIQNVINSD